MAGMFSVGSCAWPGEAPSLWLGMLLLEQRTAFLGNGSAMTYERMVLSHLEQVLQLPDSVQADIAKRVSNFLQLARAAKDEAFLSTCASAAMEEQAKAVGQGATTMDPRWAAPALAEAWCYAKLSLSKGYLDRANAVAIMEAIEAFASRQASR